MIKAKKPDLNEKDVEKFIRGAKAEIINAPVRKEKKKDIATYLLRIPRDLREQLRIEAIQGKKDMSSYICDILVNRSK